MSTTLRTFLRWAVRIAATIVCLVVVAAAAGATYQAATGNPDPARYPPPGQLVDIGGRKLHLYCTGQGSPAVILEAGLALGMVTWRHVQSEVAVTTRVCSYDRAGYGWSDPGPLPRSASHIARELHVLLEKAGIGPIGAGRPLPRRLVPPRVRGRVSRRRRRHGPRRFLT